MYHIYINTIYILYICILHTYLYLLISVELSMKSANGYVYNLHHLLVNIIGNSDLSLYQWLVFMTENSYSNLHWLFVCITETVTQCYLCFVTWPLTANPSLTTRVWFSSEALNPCLQFTKSIYFANAKHLAKDSRLSGQLIVASLEGVTFEVISRCEATLYTELFMPSVHFIS